MPTRPVPFDELVRTVAIWRTVLAEGFPAVTGTGSRSAIMETHTRLGMCVDGDCSVTKARLDVATALGLEVPEWVPIRAVEEEWVAKQVLRYRTYDEAFRAHEGNARGTTRSRTARHAGAAARPATSRGVGDSPPISPPAAPAEDLSVRVGPVLRKGPLTLNELAARLGATPPETFSALFKAHQGGLSIAERGGKWHLDDAPALGSQRDDTSALTTDKDGRLRLAVCGDMHLCSKYARLDCLEDYYDEVARRGLTTVLNTGNWIDGEAPFNKHDLLVHGLDQQMQYFGENYPRRPGVSTWAITGADHEGWYARREGVDVGRYAENVMRKGGRDDWRDMGYMECFIPITHAATGKGSKLCLMHPGGGSAYAVSYAPQKIVEGFDGGDKPSVLAIGHYHKSGYNIIRNVHTFQTGTFQDQTVFMRQKKLSAHLGGCFIDMLLDPETGAVIEFSYTFRNYFVKDYYNGRWSQHGNVQHAPRSTVA